MESMKVPAPLRTPLGTAFLSALFPGLGQAAAGMPRRGAIVAIPMLSLTAAVLLVVIIDRSSLIGAVVNQGWLTSLLLLDLAALVYHVWAIADAYLIAARARPVPRVRRAPKTPIKWPAVAAIAAILVGTVGVHGVVAQQDMQWQHTLYCLTAATPCWITDGGDVAQASPDPSDDSGDGGDIVDASASPGTSSGPNPTLATFDLSQLPTFQTTTDAENWGADGQLNVMLIGIGVQNNKSALGPDTIMVMHLDTASGKVALIGVGRNNVCVPLPQAFAANFATGSGGCPAYTWPSMINGLPNSVLANCRKFPVPGFTDTCGQSSDPNRYQRAIVAFQMTIGGLLGLNIDGSVWMNPNGLTEVINQLGGIDINVPTTVYDKPCGPAGSWQAIAGNYVCAGQYHNGYSVPNGGTGVEAMKAAAADPSANGKQSITWVKGQDIAFVIKAGQQHMSGEWALAYSRTRVFTNGGDFNRMARQQLVLKALRTTFDPCQIVGSIPKLLASVSAIPYAFNTNLPLGNAADINAWAGLAKRVLGGNIKSVIMDPATTGQKYVNGYPAVDATSWAKFKDVTAHSLDAVPAASSSGGTSGGSGC
jgi:anionic cell wall polymer biosynthesis LytR-Cps2A-Psr (LCP) family protein